MARHFRRLAGYLGINDLRDSLRSDRSWFDRAKQANESTPRFSLRIVQPGRDERYVSCVPLVPLKEAAGAFSAPQNVEEDSWSWVEVDTARALGRGMFVAQVVGRSMEPSIPDGSYCLFSAPVTGTRDGRTVLVQLSDEPDPETGEHYTVKRYESDKIETEDGAWRHLKITLRPNNPDFDPIVLTCEDEDQVPVIAELVEVLG